MARKKIEPIEGFGNTDKLTVQKSRPLFALWQSDITLQEFKILDSYLGRINSHNPEERTVRFEKGELENLLGLKQIKPTVLDERLKNLMTSVRIPDSTNPRGFTRISLFEKAYCEQDENEQWIAELTCTPSAKKYIFDIDNIGYLRYKLRNVINIKSRYSYIMFLYVWDNKQRLTWEEPLEELKVKLNCDKEETYKEFKRFNDLILKKVHKEIHEVTDIKYDYEPIKKGRRVVAIRFTYQGQDELTDNQMTLEDYLEGQEEREEPMYFAPLEDFNFSKEQLDEIQSVLVTVPEYKLPQSSACYGSIDLMRWHYLDQKAREIERRSAEKRINSKFGYLLKLIKEDTK